MTTKVSNNLISGVLSIAQGGTGGSNTVNARTSLGIGTSSLVQFASLGIGTAASAVTGTIRASNTITSGYSDERLKTDILTIENALEKIESIRGVYFKPSEKAIQIGFTSEDIQVGVIAQEVEKLFPYVVVSAPFDTEYINGKECSISGENYKTVMYEKLVPLLIQAVKEQQIQINELRETIQNGTKS